MGRKGGHKGQALQRGVLGGSWGVLEHMRLPRMRSWGLLHQLPPNIGPELLLGGDSLPALVWLSEWSGWRGCVSPSGNEIWILAVQPWPLCGSHSHPSPPHCSGQLGSDLPGPGLLVSPLTNPLLSRPWACCVIPLWNVQPIPSSF